MKKYQKRKKNKTDRSTENKLPAGKNFFTLKKNWYWLAAIIILTFIAYLPALQNGFTNWDDGQYVVQNSKITNLSFENIENIFSTYSMGNYHPLTILSFAVDYSIGQLDPFVYHLSNILLHLLNTLLVFIFVFYLFENLQLAIVTSIIFGVHPLHVESVAWISERKDVLCTLFYLIAAVYYVKFIKQEKKKYFIYSLLLFVLSLLSKAQAVSFAITIAAIDFAVGRKLTDKKVIIEKIPFVALALIFGVIAIFAQQSSESIRDANIYPLYERLAIASYGFIQYLIKLILPINLSAFYPYPDGGIPTFFWFYFLIAVCLTIIIVYSLKFTPKFFFAYSFFLINISLVLQIIPVGDAMMADRYVYIPSIGFFLLIGFGYQYLVSNKPKAKNIIISILVIYIGALAVQNYNRTKIWKDSVTLWSDVLDQFPHVPVALNNRGNVYSKELKQLDKALEDYNTSIKYHPEYSKAYSNRAIVYGMRKQFDLAIADLNTALQLSPNSLEALQNRAIAFATVGEFEKAFSDFNRCVELDVNNPTAYVNRGIAFMNISQLNSAIKDFSSALNLVPSNANAYYRRSICYFRKEEFTRALQDAQAAMHYGMNIDQNYIKSIQEKLQ
ncbi:MAG: tetratricopeptide repeat protein [Ignavibacteria bacterium]|nr:tetratricopeptide repeat protein [Ignavibacteria bacterium]